MTTTQQIAKDLIATWLAHSAGAIPPDVAKDPQKLGAWIGKAYYAALMEIDQGFKTR
jgi:hypothetical protein